MTEVTSVTQIGVQDVDGLLRGVKWATDTLTFSFPTSPDFYGSGYQYGEPGRGFEVLNATQKAVARDAFDQIASVTNLSFVEMTETASSHADLRFAMSDVPSTGWAYYPSTSEEGGDSWYRNIGGQYDNPVLGTYAYHTFMHEIGHALGLKHGHETDIFGPMTRARDSMEFSIMTYRSFVGADAQFVYNEAGGYAQTLMMYDIAALQHMYGVDYATNAGDTTYSWSPTTGESFINNAGQGRPVSNRIFSTIWDGGGVDTYDFSNYTAALTIDLRPGEWSSTSAVQRANLGFGNYARGNIANALLNNGDTRALIENAVGGTGNDRIFANAAANRLDGGAGSDTVVLAGLQSDYTFGGYILAMTASGFGVTDSLLNIEFVQFQGSGITIAVSSLVPTIISPLVLVGGAGNDRLTGEVGNDTLSGADGADTLSGLAGADQLNGDAGNDVLIGGAQGDRLNGGGGVDTALYDTALRQIGGIQRNGQQVLLTERPGGDIDTLQDVEILRFAELIVTTDVDSIAALVTRLYRAGLARDPDRLGLENWITTLDTGRPLRDVADGFILSNEFLSRYGALDNAGFVERLYLNVLGRGSDEAGRKTWLDLLNGGGSRSEVLVGFSESPENRQLTAPLLADGLVDYDNEWVFVARLYDTALDRNPDFEGARNWATAIDGGMSLDAVARGFFESPEFVGRYGGLSNTAFIDRLYRNTLDRAPEAEGLQNWLNYMAGGASRADVALGFSESMEHQMMLYARWNDEGILFG
jgi:serralysin